MKTQTDVSMDWGKLTIQLEVSQIPRHMWHYLVDEISRQAGFEYTDRQCHKIEQWLESMPKG